MVRVVCSNRLQQNVIEQVYGFRHMMTDRMSVPVEQWLSALLQP